MYTPSNMTSNWNLISSPDCDVCEADDTIQDKQHAIFLCTCIQKKCLVFHRHRLRDVSAILNRMNFTYVFKCWIPSYPHTPPLDPASMAHVLWNCKRNKACSLSTSDTVNTIYLYNMEAISIDDCKVVSIKSRGNSGREVPDGSPTNRSNTMPTLLHRDTERGSRQE